MFMKQCARCLQQCPMRCQFLDASEDGVLLQPLESRLTRISNQTAWTKTYCTAGRLDVGVISRCLVRLADVVFAEMESQWCPVM